MEVNLRNVTITVCAVALVALAVHVSRETLDDPPASDGMPKEVREFVYRVRLAALAGCNFDNDPLFQARAPIGVAEVRLYMAAQILAWLVGGSFVDTYTPRHKVVKNLMKNTVLRVAMTSDPKNAPVAVLQKNSGCLVLNVWHRDMHTKDLADSERETRLMDAVIQGLALTSGPAGSTEYGKAYKLIDEHAKNLLKKSPELKQAISLKGFKV